MGNYYKVIKEHPINPSRVSLFLINGNDCGNWYVRIRKDKGGYYQASLKTASFDIASERASLVYLKLIDSETRGRVFTNRTFGQTFTEFIKESGLSHHRKTRIQSIFRRYFLPYFKEMDLSDINSIEFNNYLRWRSSYWKLAETEEKLEHERRSGTPVFNISKVPAVSTLRGERQVMVQFLGYCVREQYISQLPLLRAKIENIEGVVASRNRKKAKALDPDLEGNIERALRDYCLDRGQDDDNWLRRFGRARLYFFIYWSRHSLIRPSSELTHVKWRDVEIQDSQKHDGYKLALINVLNSKTGKPRLAVMPYGQTELIFRWRDYCKTFNTLTNSNMFGKQEDYVFPSYKGGHELVETHLLGRLLARNLKLWGLNRTEDGRIVTMYSIARHTGITRRIERSNWDVGRIATAAGTSIQAISSSYYEAFIRQNPDRWAMTFRNGKPTLTERKLERITKGAQIWDEYLDGLDG